MSKFVGLMVVSLVVVLVAGASLLYLSSAGVGMIGLILSTSCFWLGGTLKSLFPSQNEVAVTGATNSRVYGSGWRRGGTALVFALACLFTSQAQAGTENTSRDAFVRDLTITLLETRATHISAEQHVESAYRAWVRYQELVAARSNNPAQ